MKEKEGRKKFEAQIQAEADTRVDGDVESLWAKLKESLLAVADEVCGRTKGHRGTGYHGGGMRR